ncbi:MAG: HAD family hydrolase [Patescibacteria group bacterium]
MGNSSKANQPGLAKAVFLDRDGTLIKQVELMHKIDDLEVLSGVPEAVAELNNMGFLTVIVTNQPVVARGVAKPEDIDRVHAELTKRIAVGGGKIDAVYFCPHHPEATLEQYRLQCDCRKPEPGMILKGIKEFNIDPAKSFMIGDAIIDVVAGKKAGLKTILVKSGPGHAGLDKKYPDVHPDWEAADLSEAVEIIKNA